VLPPIPAVKKSKASTATLLVKPMAKKDREVKTKPAVKSFLLLKKRERYPETAGKSE
jgi:hypothetical protein